MTVDDPAALSEMYVPYSGADTTSLDDVPPAYEPGPPAYDDVEEPPGYDLNPVFTKDGDSSSEIFDTPGPASAPAEGGAPAEQEDTTIVVHENGDSATLVAILHVLSIVCCLLSIIFSPLIEIVPAVFCIFYVLQIKESNTPLNRGLNLIDWIVTLIGLLFWICIAALLTLFSFGFLFWTFFFCIPYIVVLFACTIGVKQFCLKAEDPNAVPV